MPRPRFHLAFPVRDLAEARAFYGGLLGCPEGRSAQDWVDFDLHGHQIVAHLAPGAADEPAHSLVDGQAVPVRLRSAVGIIPLFAVETIDPSLLERFPAFLKRVRWFLDNRPDLAEHLVAPHRSLEYLARRAPTGHVVTPSCRP